jgi:hypothetical protein
MTDWTVLLGIGIPPCILFAGSVILFFRGKTMGSFLSLPPLTWRSAVVPPDGVIPLVSRRAFISRRDARFASLGYESLSHCQRRKNVTVLPLTGERSNCSLKGAASSRARYHR